LINFCSQSEDHENCSILVLVVVIFRKLKQSDDDDAVHKL